MVRTAGLETASYHIDFHLKDHPNWAVIHDLRLEYNGRIAQIDHLLIDCFLEVYVVESKNFKTKVRCKNGGWERIVGKYWEGIASPVEQNNNHIIVLKDLIKTEKLSPTRLGVSLSPTFFNAVLVNPSCSIVGSIPEGVRVFQMDRLVIEIRREDPSHLSVLKMVSSETLADFALRLVDFHRPFAVASDSSNLNAIAQKIEAPTKTAKLCSGCVGPISKEEISYCQAYAGRFAGALLCRRCQRLAPNGNPIKRKQIRVVQRAVFQLI